MYKYLSGAHRVWLLILGNYGMLFNKRSPRLGNAEYNYHDSLQARLMSGVSRVNAGCRVSFHRSSVNKETG